MTGTFLRRADGVALVEFSVILPFLLILLAGMLELANYTLQHQKIDKVANSMADFVTQGRSVSTTDLNNFGIAVPQIMRPFSFSGTVIFSSASRSTGGGCSAGCINWQHRILGSDGSRIGSAGGTPALPGGYVIPAGQDVIIAEAFLHYTPLLNISGSLIPAFTPQVIYKVAMFKPRQGALTVLTR